MISRHRPLRHAVRFVATASALVLASCGAIPPAGQTFSVNGVGYSDDTFESFLKDLSTGGNFNVANGQVSPNDVGPVLATLIRYEAYRQWNADRGVSETEQQRQSGQQRAEAQQGFGSYPTSLQELVVNLGVAEEVIASTTRPSAAELEKLYNSAPLSTGVACLSQIQVDSENKAATLLNELADGARFSDVAKKNSVDEVTRDNGGALLSPTGSPCQTLSSMRATTDVALLEAALQAAPGVPSGPVRSSNGWHIVLVAPYETVRTALAETLTNDPGNTLLNGWMATADITVDPRFGTWSNALGQIPNI